MSVGGEPDCVPFKDPGWGNDFPQLATTINAEASAAGARVPPCALGATIMRESHGQNVLQAGKPPGPGAGVGYCQITSGVNWSDLKHPTYAFASKVYDLWDPASNLYVGAAAFLAPAIGKMTTLQAKLGPIAMPNPVLFYAFACYNQGIGKITGIIEAGGDAAAVDAATTKHYASGTLVLYDQAVKVSHSPGKP
jgi:hypothetical protein